MALNVVTHYDCNYADFKKLKTLIYVFVSAFVVFLAVMLLLFVFERTINFDSNKFACDAFNEDVRLEIFGKIEDVFVDTENHNYKKFLIKETGQVRTLYLDFDRSGLFDYANIGDSIYKNTDSAIFHIIRNNVDTEFILDYGCE